VSRDALTLIEEGIYRTRAGAYRVVAQAAGQRRRKRYKATTPLPEMRRWRASTILALQADAPKAAEGEAVKLRAACARYEQDAEITKATCKVRVQQHAWWCAQPMAVGATVLSPEDVRAGKRGPEGQTLGDVDFHKLDPRRLRECLRVAFAPDDEAEDPTQYGSTSNSYRTALFHLFTVLDRDDNAAPPNPLHKVSVRPQAGAQPAGQDARIVREILAHIDSKFGRDSAISRARLGVLAWVHITPQQLKGVVVSRDFHDVEGASHEDILGGAITLTKRPRLKGRKGKRIPPPETIPLTPYGVAAMRVFAATEGAEAKSFSVSVLNRMAKRAAARAQTALAKRGVVVDLSGFTLYHLKHSLATAAAIAAPGLITRSGRIVQDPGVQKALDHASGLTTAIYTNAAVDPTVRAVNAALSLYLDRLFKTPLTQPTAIRVAK
jgi:integrase